MASPDFSDVRAIHMGGNWGVTVTQDWENEPPPAEFTDWLKSVNANWLGISVALHVDDSLDSSVERKYSGIEGRAVATFTDQALTAMIQALKAEGINVYLTLAFEFDALAQLYPVDRGLLGHPNAHQFDPEIDWENWPWAVDHPDHGTFVADFWQSYTDQAVHFATLAESLGVDMYSLGTETEALFRTRSDDIWPNHFRHELQDLVSAVRSVYSGMLTYDQFYWAVAQGRSEHGAGTRWLWKDLGLDVVGVSAYFNLTDTEPTSILSYEHLKSNWEQVFTDYLQPLRSSNPDLPITFTEFGYVDSIQSPLVATIGASQPKVFVDDNGNGLEDGEETQANIFETFSEVNHENGNLVSGTFLWGNEWSTVEQHNEVWGGLQQFTIREKVAEGVVAAEYGDPGPPGPAPEDVGTLSGIVLDAADGTTPVYPVQIGLLIPGEDDEVDYWALNNPDGTYEATGIPVGNYKVYFDAFDDSEAYLDELYNDIPCDKYLCDVLSNGDLFNVAVGASELNADLAMPPPRSTLFGRVTDSTNGAIGVSSVYVAVLDPATGADVPGLFDITNGNGNYEIGDIPPGNYKIHFNALNESEAYADELYDNIPCDGGACDLAGLGDVISINQGANSLDIDLDSQGFRITAAITDAWYNPDTSGQGFLIIVFEEIESIFLSWFTYDTELPDGEESDFGDAGHRWLTAFGEYSGDTAVLEVISSSNGQFDEGTDVQREVVGTITLRFADCEHGTADYHITAIDKQGRVAIERIVPDLVPACEEQSNSSPQQVKLQDHGGFHINPGVNDAWYQPTTDGQGFFIITWPQIEQMFLAWFSYETEVPADNTATLGDSGQRWVTALGPYEDNTAVLDINVTAGGRFDQEDEVSNTPGGTITVEFADCEAATVSYDITAIDRQGEIPVQRIVLDNVPTCQELDGVESGP